MNIDDHSLKSSSNVSSKTEDCKTSRMTSDIFHDVNKIKSSLQHMICKTLDTFYCSVNDCSESHMIHCKANMNRCRDRYSNMRDYMSCMIYCIASYKHHKFFERSDYRSLNCSLYKRACSHVHRWEWLHTWQNMNNHSEVKDHSNESLLDACNLTWQFRLWFNIIQFSKLALCDTSIIFVCVHKTRWCLKSELNISSCMNLCMIWDMNAHSLSWFSDSAQDIKRRCIANRHDTYWCKRVCNIVLKYTSCRSHSSTKEEKNHQLLISRLRSSCVKNSKASEFDLYFCLSLEWRWCWFTWEQNLRSEHCQWYTYCDERDSTRRWCNLRFLKIHIFSCRCFVSMRWQSLSLLFFKNYQQSRLLIVMNWELNEIRMKF